MQMLTGQQKKKLKSMAHHLKPVVYIGRNGITDSLVSALEKSLSDHELVKIKFVDFKEEKHGLIESLVEQTGAELISIIGNTTVLFRQNKDPKLRKINT